MKDFLNKLREPDSPIRHKTYYLYFTTKRSPPLAEILQLVEVIMYYLYYLQCVTCVTDYSKRGSIKIHF